MKYLIKYKLYHKNGRIKYAGSMVIADLKSFEFEWSLFSENKQKDQLFIFKINSK